MSSLKEKERFKEQQEKFQAVLSALLKDEDNKYCVDCDAKGPRWASWNLGIFLCIRCAGIHRNLGVHISKVKSVNLDTWTPEQVAMMQEMGNSRGRAVYEANIPDGFRRPQTDSSLEAFIRSKYEQKKYIAREWIPPQPRVPKEWLDDPKGDRKKAKSKPAAAGSIQLTNVPKQLNKPSETTPSGDFAKPAQGPKIEAKSSVRTETITNSASNDLLGLEAAAPLPSSGGNELLDLFGGPQMSETTLGNTAPAQTSSSDLMNGTTEGNLFGEEKGSGGGTAKTSAKDSIMALYGGGGGGGGSGSGPSQPQMYGIPASQPNMTITPAHANEMADLMKVPDNSTFISAQALVQQAVASGQPQNMQQQFFNQSSIAVSSPDHQLAQFTQSSSSLPGLTNQQVFGQGVATFGVSANQIACDPNMLSGQCLPYMQPSAYGLLQKQTPISTSSQVPANSGQISSSSLKKMPDFSNKPSFAMVSQEFGQPMGANSAWSGYNQSQPTFYGNQGGMYMPQNQQMYPGMMTQQQQQQGMMGMQGMRPQGMMGQPLGMVVPPQGMGMIGQGMVGQPMMANPAVNTPQMAMYNSQMMAGSPAVYTPQQMQQLQFQQMQHQMTSLKLSGSQMNSMPQQAAGGATAGWANAGQGQTLSTNLWQ